MSIKDKYTIRAISRSEAKDWILKKHYAKRMPVVSYTFGLLNKKLELQGIITFGPPPIGTWQTNFQILELNRLCINEHLEKNVLSFFVSNTLKKLPVPLLIVSFADPNHGHHGYIYQATNWIYTGVGSTTVNWYLGKKKYHNRHMYKSSKIFIDIIKSNSKNNILDTNKTDKELWADIGGRYEIQKPKHRYFYILGDKSGEIKKYLNTKYSIMSYPKGDNQRYKIDNEIINKQMRLF